MDTICPYVYQTSVLFKGLCLFIYIRIDSCLGIRINPHSSVGKESACNVGDLGLIPGYGRSPGEGMAIHSSILAWKIPWTEEPGGLQSTGSQESDTT